jgi:hypothetical protein
VEAHRCILAARSGFFEGAFSPSAFQEARTGSIHIRNFSSPAAFSAFLRFLYTDELNVLEADDILLELLCKCDFYALRSDRLKQLCVERLNLLPKVVPAPAWKVRHLLFPLHSVGRQTSFLGVCLRPCTDDGRR